MTKMQDAVVTAARTLVGVRFRPQGRDPDHGLDCVGLAAAALEDAGRLIAVPNDYPQRGGNADGFMAAIDRSGLGRIDPADAAGGDLLLIETGAAQFHLAIRTEAGVIHADAGLRRVVETAAQPAGTVIAAWRVEEA